MLKGKNLDADDLAKVDLLRRVQVGMEELFFMNFKTIEAFSSEDDDKQH